LHFFEAQNSLVAPTNFSHSDFMSTYLSELRESFRLLAPRLRYKAEIRAFFADLLFQTRIPCTSVTTIENELKIFLEANILQKIEGTAPGPAFYTFHPEFSRLEVAEVSQIFGILSTPPLSDAAAATLDATITDLLSIFREITVLKGGDDYLAAITCVILIKGEVTPKQIEAATGISRSKISGILSLLLERGGIVKFPIPGTKEHLYKFPRPFFDLAGQEYQRIHHIIKSQTSFLMELFEKIAHLPEKSPPGLDFFIYRLNQFHRLLQMLGQSLQEISAGKYPNEVHALPPLQISPNPIITPFSPVVVQIEQEFIEFLINSPLFIRYNVTTKRILAYLFTRQKLTDDQLNSLLRFSGGVIASSMEKVIQIGLVKATRLSEVTEVYEIRSIPHAYRNLFFEAYDRLEGWKNSLSEIQKKLSVYAVELASLAEFQNITKFIEGFLGIIPLFENFNAKINHLL
jgi:DNA-binding transcriptional regulator GbsR (MarR family)